MATPNATDPSLKSNDPTTEDFDSEDLNSKDPKFENLSIEELKPENAKPDDTNPNDTKPEDTIPEDTIPDDAKPEDAKPEDAKPDDAKPDDIKPEDAKPEDVKSEAEEDQDSHAATVPVIPFSPIPVTSNRWQTTIENLLRFPGMVSQIEMRLFRTSNPIAEIALALGVTDSAYSIIESSWVPIAERVIEVQSCCMMNAKHIDFNIASDGWITWDVTAEWCARVMQDLQGKGFRTTSTAMVGFVVRVYLQTISWVRYRQFRGRQMHKQVMDALKPDPSAQVITRCSMMARSFTNAVRLNRKRAIERAEEQNSRREPPAHSDNGT